jgi:transposase-like protein
MRREFQRSKAPTAGLAREADVNPKTVAKWRRRKGPAEFVARQSGWESSDNQEGHFGGRGGVMIVAARR